MTRAILLSAAILTSVTTPTLAYQETWDDAVAANHNWVTDYDQKGIWQPMFHESTGGVAGGHVWTDLDDLLIDVFPGGGLESSPAWLQGPDPEQDVDFTSKTIALSTKLDAGSDLAGSLHFYIGTWSNGGHFFYHSDPILPGDDQWNETLMAVGPAGDPAAWSDLYVVNDDLDASDIFNQPEEYGFMILLDADSPTGTLRFDNLRIVPEPTSAILLAGAACWLLRRRT